MTTPRPRVSVCGSQTCSPTGPVPSRGQPLRSSRHRRVSHQDPHPRETFGAPGGRRPPVPRSLLRRPRRSPSFPASVSVSRRGESAGHADACSACTTSHRGDAVGVVLCHTAPATPGVGAFRAATETLRSPNNAPWGGGNALILTRSGPLSREVLGSRGPRRHRRLARRASVDLGTHLCPTHSGSGPAWRWQPVEDKSAYCSRAEPAGRVGREEPGSGALAGARRLTEVTVSLAVGWGGPAGTGNPREAQSPQGRGWRRQGQAGRTPPPGPWAPSPGGTDRTPRAAEAEGHKEPVHRVPGWTAPRGRLWPTGRRVLQGCRWPYPPPYGGGSVSPWLGTHVSGHARFSALCGNEWGAPPLSPRDEREWSPEKMPAFKSSSQNSSLGGRGQVALCPSAVPPGGAEGGGCSWPDGTMERTSVTCGETCVTPAAGRGGTEVPGG